MAKKRFTDAEKYNDPWFTDLSAKLKAVYLYMLDTCDCAGVWKSNFKMIKAHWEISVNHDDMVGLLPKVERFNDECYIITNFIRFQYGDNMNQNSNITKGILKSIEYNGLQSKGLIRVDEGLVKGSPRGKDKDKDKGKDKDKEKDNINNNKLNINKIININNSDFDLEHIYAMYPRKEGKKSGIDRLKKIIKTQEKYDQVLLAVKNYAQISKGKEKQYIKHFSSFVSNWEDYLKIEIEPDGMEALRERFKHTEVD